MEIRLAVDFDLVLAGLGTWGLTIKGRVAVAHLGLVDISRQLGAQVQRQLYRLEIQKVAKFCSGQTHESHRAAC
jgi:hypothetical protein